MNAFLLTLTAKRVSVYGGLENGKDFGRRERPRKFSNIKMQFPSVKLDECCAPFPPQLDQSPISFRIHLDIKKVYHPHVHSAPLHVIYIVK